MGAGGKSLPARIRWYVYLSHALSTWGDRMWGFGVGLFLVIISPESLRVTAVYGFSIGIATLLFGALVGDWVDKTPRLTAARTSLVCQNTSVIVCTCTVFLVITYKEQIQKVWPNEGLLTLCYAVIITIAVISTLASMGTSIAVQRDWIVEICGKDKDLLASTTATLRRIDLTTKILAPIATGQIMTYVSVGVGALFIGGWNLVSVFVEYILLWKVYCLVPALRNKKLGKDKKLEAEEEEQEMVDLAMIQREAADVEIIVEAPSKDSDEAEPASTTKTETCDDLTEEQRNEPVDETVDGEIGEMVEEATPSEKDALTHAIPEESESTIADGKKDFECGVCMKKMFSGIFILIRGWKTYMKYNVAFAGLGLSALYMTVLGFDNITVGFAYTQGINESVMGILMAAAAIAGILGTFLYPIIRKRIGLERTGLFGFFFEICFLTLCVASVWAPGSPFDPFMQKTMNAGTQLDCLNNNSTAGSSQPSVSVTPMTDSNITVQNTNTVTYRTSAGNSVYPSNTTGLACMSERHWQSYISVALLMAGIIGARCGLWMADLTITQLFLENIQEHERGIVNGVQTSLNRLMDMLKFILVIAAPQAHQFGILILISFAFICLGWACYSRYSYQVRGHLFHFDKVTHCNNGCSNNNNNMPVSDA